MKKLIVLVSPILTLLTICQVNLAVAYEKILLIGSIQFPTSVTSVPEIRMYRGGYKISSENHESTKKISFSIPESKKRTNFSLIITEPRFRTEKNTNTIECLSIKPQQPYKFFTLDLVMSDDTDQSTYLWHIQEHKNGLLDGKIPDDALIIYYKPEWIQSVVAGAINGNTIEFKIIIKDDIIELAGSQALFDDVSATILISAIDLDAIHTNFKHEIRQHKQATSISIVA